MQAAEQDAFFESYNKAHVKKTKGITNFQMNAPLVQNGLPGIIGMELEIEGRNLPREGDLDGIRTPTTDAYWRVVNDGSLRNGGLEYIFSTPVLEQEIRGIVEGLFKRFKDVGTKFALSNRCSSHVHINMKGKTVNQVTSIIAVWAVFEEALINFCGEERKTNHFALSMQDAVTTIRSWDNFLRFGQMNWPEELKYAALNIASIPRMGSLEFRCGKMTQEPDWPIQWALFINRLVDFAVERYPNPMSLASDMSERGAYTIFDEICQDFPDLFKEVLSPYSKEQFDELCMKGFRNVQPIVMGYPWHEWMDLIGREFVPNPFVKTGKKAIHRWQVLAEEPIQRAQPLDPVPIGRLDGADILRRAEQAQAEWIQRNIQAQQRDVERRRIVEEEMWVEAERNLRIRLFSIQQVRDTAGLAEFINRKFEVVPSEGRHVPGGYEVIINPGDIIPVVPIGA